MPNATQQPKTILKRVREILDHHGVLKLFPTKDQAYEAEMITDWCVQVAEIINQEDRKTFLEMIEQAKPKLLNQVIDESDVDFFYGKGYDHALNDFEASLTKALEGQQ